MSSNYFMTVNMQKVKRSWGHPRVSLEWWHRLYLAQSIKEAFYRDTLRRGKYHSGNIFS